MPQTSVPGRAARSYERPLRILLVPSAYYPHVGGIEEATRQLAIAFGAKGNEVAILTHLWPAGVLRAETLDGVGVTRLPFPLPTAQPITAARFVATASGAGLHVLQQVRRGHPDVVHVIGGGPTSAYLALLRRLLGSRLVFTAQGLGKFDASGTTQRSAALRAGLRRMLASADAVTACSAYVLRGLEEVGPVGSSSCVIPNGVEPADFAGCPPEEGLGRYVLAVGRLVHQKGFDVLLEAFRSERLAGLNLVLAGEGAERPRLEAQAERLGLGHRVRFLGSVNRERLASLLQGARALAFPSRYEPFGIALLEAMAAGVPAVAAASGGILEFARDGENALVVPPENPDALASALARIDVDLELRQRLSGGGRETARKLTWSRIADRYLDVYQP
jgi:glycogen synthase